MSLLLGSLLAGLILADSLPGGSTTRTEGERAYQKCYSCHAIEPGRHDLTGPSLHGIFDRRVASVQGYDYSPALRRFAARNPRWTRALVDRYAADPDRLVPGTSMDFHGMRDHRERRALIDYLARLGG